LTQRVLRYVHVLIVLALIELIPAIKFKCLCWQRLLERSREPVLGHVTWRICEAATLRPNELRRDAEISMTCDACENDDYVLYKWCHCRFRVDQSLQDQDQDQDEDRMSLSL